MAGDPVYEFLNSGTLPQATEKPLEVSSSNDPVYNFFASGNTDIESMLPKEVQPTESPVVKSWGDYFKNWTPLAVGDAAVSAGISLLAQPIGQAVGAIETAVGKFGKYGSPEATEKGAQRASQVREQLTWRPRTEGGQEILSGAGKVFDESKLAGLNPAEGMALASATKFKPKIPKLSEVPKDVLVPERAQILSRVGLDEARKSAIEGDPKAAATDFQQSRLDNPGGYKMRAVLENEKQTLQNYTERLAEDAGGSLGMSEDHLYARGSTIAKPFDDIKKVLSDARNALYEEADKRAGGSPSIKLESFNDFLKRDSEFEGKAENGNLRKGVRSYLKEQHILKDDGSLNPINAKSAEGLRQYINSQWSPQTSGLAGKLKGMIDSDVLDNAGSDIYGTSREMHKKIKETLDNPGGISKLMDYEPNNPINRAMPYEKIPDFINRLPLDQFQHVIKVLKESPPEIQAQAQTAIGEIKSHIVNKILDEGGKNQGQWNAKNVSKVLSTNESKIKLLFSESEQQKLKDLNDAGHILKIETGYPGSSVQKHNLLTRGAMAAIPAVSAGAGGAVLGEIGAAGGALLGNAAANKIAEKATLRSAQKRLTKISDLTKGK